MSYSLKRGFGRGSGRSARFGKRGIDDSQFHWLFVLLAGGFILFMFALFISQGIAANQQKQTAQLLQYFDSVLSSSQNVQHLDQAVDSLPSLTIQQDCEANVASRLTFVEQSLAKEIPTLAVYSAHKISGDKYAVKTLPYDAPFRVDNPIYLTDSKTLYVVYDADQAVGQKYLDLLPAHATKVWTDDLSKITQTGFRDIVIITENQGQLDSAKLQQLPASLLDANIRVVDVQMSATPTQVYYYYKRTYPNQGVTVVSPKVDDSTAEDSVTFTDDATLLGAIMADDPTLYDCNLAKLQKSSQAVAMQIAIRAQELSVANVDGRCKASYADANGKIFSALGGADPSSTLADKNWQDDLAAINQRLITYSCPSLY